MLSLKGRGAPATQQRGCSAWGGEPAWQRTFDTFRQGRLDAGNKQQKFHRHLVRTYKKKDGTIEHELVYKYNTTEQQIVERDQRYLSPMANSIAIRLRRYLKRGRAVEQGSRDEYFWRRQAARGENLSSVTWITTNESALANYWRTVVPPCPNCGMIPVKAVFEPG